MGMDDDLSLLQHTTRVRDRAHSIKPPASVFYHAGCYDGFGAAYCFYKYLFGDTTKYVPFNWGDPMPDEDLDYIFVDVSPKPEELIGRSAKIIVLDHHDSNINKFKDKVLPPNVHTVFDLSKSGTHLAYLHANQSSIKTPLWVRLIEDRDLWNLELQGSEEFFCFLQSIPMDFKCWYAEDFDDLHHLGKCIDDGVKMLKFKNRIVKEMASTATIQNIGGDDVPVANASAFFSEVASLLLDLHPDRKFSAVYRIEGNTKKWSLRSRKTEDVRVNDVAAKFGGGGHPNASGFTEKI